MRDIFCPVCRKHFKFPRRITSVFVVCPSCSLDIGSERATRIWIEPGTSDDFYAVVRDLSECDDRRSS